VNWASTQFNHGEFVGVPAISALFPAADAGIGQHWQSPGLRNAPRHVRQSEPIWNWLARTGRMPLRLAGGRQGEHC
jgi:hypothetical protein